MTASRPTQMTRDDFQRLVDRGDVDAIERAVRAGRLDDVRARLRAANPQLVAGLAISRPVDDAPGWLDH